jgi:hypothetical protein
MKKYRIHWYDQHETRLIEPNLIEANDTEEAEGKARSMYFGRKEPAPLIFAEEVN